jgi:hypothetical protein
MSNDADQPGNLAQLKYKNYIITLLGFGLLLTIFKSAVLWVHDFSNVRIAVAARDYTDMWAAGHFAAVGKFALLYDREAFAATLRSMFGVGFPEQIWPYPPPILLVAVPLSALPLFPGFLLYTAATLALLWAALRSGGLTRASCAIILISPAVGENALAGQNGALTTAVILGGLLHVDSRPILSGALLGTLVIKPQLGLLLPLCLVASGNWRALVSAAFSASILIGLSCMSFGLGAWIEFLKHVNPMVAAILEAPWQASPSQRIFTSVFMGSRSIGASIQIAYCFQLVTVLLCAAVAWWAWRISKVVPLVRAVLTALLTLLAAPWVHTYDMIPLAVGVVVLFSTAPRKLIPLLVYAWIWPGAVILLIPAPLAPFILCASVMSIGVVAWLATRQLQHDDRESLIASNIRVQVPPSPERTG